MDSTEHVIENENSQVTFQRIVTLNDSDSNKNKNKSLFSSTNNKVKSTLTTGGGNTKSDRNNQNGY